MKKINSERMKGESNPSKRKDVREKQSIAGKKRMAKSGANFPIHPNYNTEGCKIIEKYGTKHGFNFQHAENGGEVCIGGIFPDCLDEQRKTIIEIDEKYHFLVDGTLKEKDIKRQKYLESLDYTI